MYNCPQSESGVERGEEGELEGEDEILNELQRKQDELKAVVSCDSTFSYVKTLVANITYLNLGC